MLKARAIFFFPHGALALGLKGKGGYSQETDRELIVLEMKIHLIIKKRRIR
jgi:hypothetical protein